MQTQVVNFIVEQFKKCDNKDVFYCIRIVGNMIAVNEPLCTELLKKGLLDCLKKVFSFCTKAAKKEALWLISNIAANSD